MGRPYQAVTYGDLALLHADLPRAASAARQEPAQRAVAPPACVTRRGVLADLPAALKVLWTIWLAAVSINLVVWALVSGTTGTWPIPGRCGWPARTGPRCSRCRLP